MNEQELAHALRRLNDATVPPPVDPARASALMAAFDAASARPSRPSPPTRGYWPMAALAAAAAVLIAVALPSDPVGRRGLALQSSARDVRPDVSEFVMVPAAANLPPMESGSLVRMDVPVSMLPSLGVTPPATGRATVTADLVIGQDGLTRAVRLVN
jgi:hypothetical protein